MRAKMQAPTYLFQSRKCKIFSSEEEDSNIISSYSEVAASFSDECPPANSSLAWLTWNFSSSVMPDFPIYETLSDDLTILGPKSPLVYEFTKDMNSIYNNQRNMTRDRRHAGTVYLLLLNKMLLVNFFNMLKMFRFPVMKKRDSLSH